MKFKNFKISEKISTFDPKIDFFRIFQKFQKFRNFKFFTENDVIISQRRFRAYHNKNSNSLTGIFLSSWESQRSFPDRSF